ncbi:MAG: hypothetical protein GF331_21090 [Chitinivibrionales bacterium]|nr:hypothetical protein [Chitinivibrionales bacterium]
MRNEVIWSIAAVLLLAVIHPASAFVSHRHVRRRTISLCAGIALAYAFLHLLPELAEMQNELLTGAGEQRRNPWFREHLYVLALTGLLLFQVVDSMGRRAVSAARRRFSYRAEMSFFALYAALIGYLITGNAELNRPIVLITVALAAHLFGTDLDLAERYEEAFVTRGSYVLAAATIAGMVLAFVMQVNERLLMAGFAFLVGGLLINTLRTELPEPERVRNLFLLMGAVFYAVLLLVIYSVTRQGNGDGESSRARFHAGRNRTRQAQVTTVNQGKRIVAPLWLALVGLTGIAVGQSPDTTQLSAAQQTQNPIANLVRIRIANATSFGIGPNGRNANSLAGQVRLPFDVGRRLTLIVRSRLALAYQPNPATTTTGDFGLGDLRATVFFAWPVTREVIWGFGPRVVVPTATDATLGRDKWVLGVTLAAAYTLAPNWGYAVEVNNSWSIAGDKDRPDINAFFVRPVVSYLVPPERRLYLFTAPLIEADWIADSENRWIVPIGAGAGLVSPVGDMLLDLSAQAYWIAERPDGGADWVLQLLAQVLFPRTRT